MLSVTEVLQTFSDYSGVPAWKLEKASSRGTSVHSICSAHALNIYIGEIPEEIAGFYASFLKWWPYVREVLFVEKEFTDPVHGYMGHPDLGVVLWDYSRVVVDLKTPLTAERVWRGQCAAYLNLVKEDYGITRCGTLQLRPDGRFPLMRWYNEDGRDFFAFLQALYAVRYFKKGE